MIATKTFDDLPAQGLLQQLNDQSIVFGPLIDHKLGMIQLNQSRRRRSTTFSIHVP
ncbi:MULTISPECIES: hypothetical protein [Paenibacillus]|uniref:Uncharacterized protein n=1 Tax=Paenibacillus cucumis (ex Kampfer et al. 2016) TaxID=1776858 RepID=A0ABS7KLN8_9BACL|nr:MULTISPECIES: hypothetical protein [Paenibacillus]MBY0205054.1 hypothetical protein [Paenibacillus cucumis (ex Kampfer et al. 2016)]